MSTISDGDSEWFYPIPKDKAKILTLTDADKLSHDH
jgi:hypothetical protein